MREIRGTIHEKGHFISTMLLLSLVLMACGNESTSSESDDSSNSENKSVEKLSIGFVPSRDPEEIITATDPLKDLLKEELAFRL